MLQIAVVGIGAGIASAALFAPLVSGKLISIVAIILFYFAPLPILIAALGWSHWAGLFAAIVASLGLAAFFGGYAFLGYFVAIAFPAWWLGYLALLSRPVATPAGERLEWYPVGRLVLWTALLSALVIVVALLSLGASEESLRAAMRRGLLLMLRLQEGSLQPPDLNRQIDALVRTAPPAAAVSVTFVNLALLWLAARIVSISGQLRRPWPELTAMAFPAHALTLLAVAVAGLLFGGFIGILSSVFAASLAAVYAVLGFAVLHTITRGMNTRGFALACVYCAVAVVTPALVIIALLGLADTAFDIRGRMAAKGGPPTLRT
jgi:Predicted membrane protein (DUF2232)